MPKKNKPEELKSWAVFTLETVCKKYITVPCTREDAENRLFEVNETPGEEVECYSWEVSGVEDPDVEES